MDPSLIRRLQRLHVLRAGGHERRERGRRSMEALVRDLSHALEESSSSSHRRRRGWRRRSRSAGTLSGAPREFHFFKILSEPFEWRDSQGQSPS